MATAKKSNDVSSRSITASQLIETLAFMMRAKIPTFVWGAPGIGKSDCVRAVAKKQGNREVIDVRLSQLDPTDLRGLPYVSQKTDIMNWSAPNFLPTDPNSTAIIFLDELNSAPGTVQAAAYQLILDRCVGNYRLPDGVDIIAAGNRDGDKGVTYRMATPLANRLVHLELAVDGDEWISWAVDNRLNADVVSYISWRKDHLMQFDSAGTSKAFATPRTWSFVSRLLNEAKVSKVDNVTITNAVCGAIGEGVGISFMAHRKISGELPAAKDILSGKVTKLTLGAKEISACYALTIALIYDLLLAQEKAAKAKGTKDEALLNDEFNKMFNYFLAFILNNFTAELCVLAAKLAVNNNQMYVDTSKIPEFKRFTAEYGKYITKKK